ncbi:MAG: glycosyltransferase family 39 protein [bacterium]|nr:glycosyltransferase family 39 protein [bacterium]
MKFLNPKFTIAKQQALLIYYLLRRNRKLCLFTIIMVGGFSRFYNLNWDQGHFFHPDERNIAMAVSNIRFFDQLNPHFFAYGSFPIYLYRAVCDLLFNLTGDIKWINEWPNINLVGRFFSALFSTASIALIFLLGKKLVNKNFGLLAAFLMAFNASLIQTAHFGVTESMLVFWLLLITLLSLKISGKPTIKYYLLTGIVFGLAVSTKISALSFVVIPATAHFLFHFRKRLNHLNFLVFLFFSFSFFTIFSPYVFLDQVKFLESMNYETAVALGHLKVPYILQFEKTQSYLFQIKNFFWQMGPSFVLAIPGALLFLLYSFKKKDKKLLIILIFPVVYFIYVGHWYTKFLRYMVPVLPFLILFASWFIWELKKKYKILGTLILSLILILTFLWSIAFFSIYTRPQTRIAASEWVYQNITPGAKILTEHWDDGLPVDLGQNSPGQYNNEQLTIYEPDNQIKLIYYAQKLSNADYIIINSRRLYGTLIYLPEKYPLTSRYYQLLFSGKLGYTKVAEFTSYPQIFGVQINDDSSEETFQVYEHPKVIIFKNQSRLSFQNLARILNQ